MSPVKAVNVGGVLIGDGYPTVFMAETSTYFNQDIDLAVSFVEAAAEAGAQIFKSEILHSPEVILKNTGLRHEFRHAKGSTIEEYHHVIERKVMSLDGYRTIYGRCRELGIPFVSSVYDVEGIDFLVNIGGAGVKIARDNINNIALIRYAANTGLPVIFDAGATYIEEVARAIHTAQSAGTGGVIVNHHPAANPATPEVHNMQMIQFYKDAFNIPVGLACHYRGDEMLYLATGMGANILEKGIVDDPGRAEQDLVSATPLSELAAVVQKVNNCWQAIGHAPASPKEPRDLTTRKGLIAKHPISAGDLLGLNNLGFAFPNLGVSVEHWDLVVNRHAARNLELGESLNWGDIRLDDGPAKDFAQTVTRS